MDFIGELLEKAIKEKEIVAIVIGGLAVLLVILLIILFVKNRRLNKRLETFMKGSTTLSLEEEIRDRFLQIEKLQEENIIRRKEVERINENLLGVYQKMGIVKYDAFNEMGGKLSFVATLLNKNNNGLMLNSVYSTREGCYVYLKEIINGESFLDLSEEEKKSLKEAVDMDKLI